LGKIKSNKGFEYNKLIKKAKPNENISMYKEVNSIEEELEKTFYLQTYEKEDQAKQNVNIMIFNENNCIIDSSEKELQNEMSFEFFRRNQRSENNLMKYQAFDEQKEHPVFYGPKGFLSFFEYIFITRANSNQLIFSLEEEIKKTFVNILNKDIHINAQGNKESQFEKNVSSGSVLLQYNKKESEDANLKESLLTIFEENDDLDLDINQIFSVPHKHFYQLNLQYAYYKMEYDPQNYLDIFEVKSIGIFVCI